MATAPNSVIGIDLGHYAFKSVVMQRRVGNRFQLTHYAVRATDGPVETPEQTANQVKLLLKEMGGSAKACVVAVTSPEAIIRIIEQPETPCEILRDALRINGFSMLNQDCRDYVLDCDLAEANGGNEPHQAASPGRGAQKKYLVGGLPRKQVARIAEAFQKSHCSLDAIQLAPVSIFNAFEFSNGETFGNEAFLLVDIGHAASTVTVGFRKELIIVRSFDHGARELIDTLVHHGGDGAESVLSQLEEGDEILLETARLSLSALTREIGSSIGFFEGHYEENITKVFVSGAAAKSRTILKILTEELHMPCEAWNPFLKCELALSGSQKAGFANDIPRLNVACGAALELLKS